MKRNLFRRALACLCLCAVLSGGLCVPARAAGFRDVPAGHWAADAISQCVTQGWFQGKSADTFGVGQPMTRSAFAVVLSRFFGWQSSGAYYQIFSDVPQGAWYEPALRACYEHGAVTRQTGTYRPGDAVTREELAVTLIRALGYGPIAGLAGEDTLPFRDVTTNRGHIAMAYAMGLVSGTGQSTFAPDRAATREQAAVMLSRLYHKLHPAGSGETILLLQGSETLPETADCTTLVLMAGTLTGGQNAQLSVTLSAAQSAALAQKNGKAVLLGVTGQSGTLSADTKSVARLAQAVTEGGYDGLYLDIGQPANDNGHALGALVQRLRTAMPDKRLYVAVDAPARGQTVPDYTEVGKAADRLVLRLPAYTDSEAAVPVHAMEPPETVYYALSILTRQLSAEKLSLRLTVEGRCLEGNKSYAPTADTRTAVLAQGSTHYSDRYACAYTQSGKLTLWYLNGRSLTERQQLLRCFGADSVCLSTGSGTLSLTAE